MSTISGQKLLTMVTSYFLSTVKNFAPPTTSTQVFYISVSVCCIVIFLVAIILAILHLHSMKRVEMEDRLACFAVTTSLLTSDVSDSCEAE